MPLQAVAATAAQKFVDTIGVNTHIDFTQNAYGNFAAVQRALAYLGVKSVRDAYQNPADGAKFTSLHNDLGISFDLFIGPLPDGPEPYATQLQQIESLAPGVVASVEGVNEPDIFGRSLSDATAFQQTLYASVHANMPGIPVLQLTFGNVDDYGITGDQSAFADFANAHTFFGSGNNPAFQSWIGTLNADALRTTPRKPIIVTELGYTTSGSTTNQHDVNDVEQAKYTLDITLDMFKAGDVRTYLYELLDEQTGSTERENTFGLFFSDGTPKPSGTAVHNLISLLSDARAATAPPPGALTYSLGGMPNTGNSLLMQKSDGVTGLRFGTTSAVGTEHADADHRAAGADDAGPRRPLCLGTDLRPAERHRADRQLQQCRRDRLQPPGPSGDHQGVRRGHRRFARPARHRSDRRAGQRRRHGAG